MAVSVELYFLLHDVGPASPFVAEEDSIAELLSARRGVHRQRPGELLWYESQAGDRLLQGESVLTLEGSGAEVGFTDGSALVLGENTLVRVERPSVDGSGTGPSVLTVTLLRGRLGRKARAGKAQAAPGPVSIRAGDVEVAAAADADLTVAMTPEFAAVQVQGGSAEVSSAAGRARAAAGEAVTIEAAHAPVVSKIEVAAVSPADGGVVMIPPGRETASVRFAYRAAGEKSGETRIEVARDPGFKDRFATLEPSGRGAAEWEARAGHWYWRVGARGRDGRWAWSSPSSLVVEPAPVPQALMPIADARRPAGGAVEFAWSAVGRASGYELRIAPEGGAEPTVVRSSRPYAAAGPLPAGTYSWEARSVAPDGSFSAWSAARTLRITGPEEEELAPPASLTGGEFLRGEPVKRRTPSKAREKRKAKPKRGGALFFWMGSEAWAEERSRGRLERPLADPAPRTWKVRLNWEAVPKAAEYRVQVARDEAFSDVLADARVTGPEYLWIYQKGLEGEGGRVYYRVASVTRKGKEGRFSDPRAVPIPEEVLAGTADQSVPVEVYSAVEETDLPKPAAPPKLAPKPVVPPKPVAPVAVVTKDEPAVPFFNGTRVSLGLGWGRLKQSSADPALSRVSVEAPYPSSRLGIESRIRPGGSGWTVRIDWDAAAFDGPTEGRTTLQEKATAHSFRVSAVRRIGALGLGALLERSYRWVKTGPQSLSPEGALSFGPSLALEWALGRGFGMYRVGATVDLPLTGAVTGGALGVDGRAWVEWTPGAFGARIETDASIRRWKEPESTSVTDWRLWAAVTYRLSGSEDGR